MIIVEQTLLITAPIDLVYHISQDNITRDEWDLTPEPLSLVARDDALPGTAGSLQQRSNFGITVTLDFLEPSPPASARMRMSAGPAFLTSYVGAWTFEERSPNHTFVTFHYAIDTAPGLLQWLRENAIALYLNRSAGKRLAALKAYCQKRHMSGKNKGMVPTMKKKFIPRF